MSKTWFISDTHFWHTKILEYENRPFETIEDMNSYIIRQWNNVVSKDDIVWFLGDLCLGHKQDIKNIMSQLHGRKRMIRGNHDNWSDSFYKEIGFEFVSKYPIILKDFFVLSHSPLPWMGKSSPFFYIYGHVHGSPSFVDKSENSCCVCVERWDYTPIRIPEFDNYKK